MTTVVRVSSPADGVTILPRNYAYWQAINAHASRPELRVLAGTLEKGPCLWTVSKADRSVAFDGPVFAEGHPLAGGTGEGWRFSPTDPDVLYCSDDERLLRHNVATGATETVVDIAPLNPFKEYALRQWHSSRDGTVHSATVLRRVEDGPWPKLGSVVFSGEPIRFFKAKGVLDECQIDKNGRWLLIKEDDDNRIIDLSTGEERFIADADGAAGHSDNGWGYVVGADNQCHLATWRLWDFATLTSRVVHEGPWDPQILHVSHCHAACDAPPARQWVLGSGTCASLVKIPLDGSPATELLPTGCVIDPANLYDSLPKASLDPYGAHAFWICWDGARRDALIARL